MLVKQPIPNETIRRRMFGSLPLVILGGWPQLAVSRKWFRRNRSFGSWVSHLLKPCQRLHRKDPKLMCPSVKHFLGPSKP